MKSDGLRDPTSKLAFNPPGTPPPPTDIYHPLTCIAPSNNTCMYYVVPMVKGYKVILL